MHGLSYSKACGILLDQGSNTCLPWQVDSLPLSHQVSPLTLIFVSSHARPLEVRLASQPLLCTWQKLLRTTIASSIRITSLESCPLQDLGTAVPHCLVSSSMFLRVSEWVCVCVCVCVCVFVSVCEFPGCLVLGFQAFTAWGQGSIPGQGTKILQAILCSPHPRQKKVCVWILWTFGHLF